MSEFLQHFGILKMKWGVRRFQNPDGTLTEAGKLRYRKSDVENDFHETLAKHPEEVGHIRELGPKLERKCDELYEKYEKAFGKVELTSSEKEHVWNNLKRDFSSGNQIDDPEIYELAVDEELEPVYDILLNRVSESLKKERVEYEQQYDEYRKQVNSVISDLTRKYGEAKLEAPKLLPAGPSNLSANRYIQSLAKITFSNPLAYDDFDGMLIESLDYMDAHDRIAKEFSLEEFKKRYP